MKSKEVPHSNQAPSLRRKLDTSSVSETLTPSEIEQLRQEKKEDNAYFRKAFAHMKKQRSVTYPKTEEGLRVPQPVWETEYYPGSPPEKVEATLSRRDTSDDSGNAAPWRDAYPECSKQELTGKALAGARYREGLTQVQLSELTGIPQRHISEMENGKRPIGKEMAKRLGKALNISYKVFL